MALTDYQKDPEGARKEENDWVENKTKENIKNLIPEGVFTIPYNTITLFKEGSAITCYSFLTYGPQKNR